MTYHAEQLWPPFSECLLDWDHAFHDLMLGDRLRMTAYRKAIFESVKPGDRVLDLGTGTGILSQWALEAGAQRVYGVDLSAEILGEATARIAAAGFAERFEPIHALSYDVRLAEPVDVLLSEIIGNLADNEDFQPILADAIARLVRPGAVILPQSTASYLVPVAAEQAHRGLRDGVIAALTPRYQIEELYRDKQLRSPFNLYYDCILPRSTYLSAPTQVCRYDGRWEQAATYQKELVFALRRGGALTGFKGYFIAELTPHTTLDISGDDIDGGQTSDSWKHAFLPIERPIEVQEGDELIVQFQRRYPGGRSRFRQVYRWRGSVRRSGAVVATFDHSMDERELA